MRKTAVLFAPALLAVVALACENDPELGPPPTIDIPDSGGFDVNRPEIDVPDAPAVGVTVLVFGTTGPVSGVRVVSHDAQGAQTGSTMTGADGRATFGTVPSMVSALIADRRNFNRSIVTWVGVEAGDVLALNQFMQDDDQVNQVNVSLTATSPGAIQYRVTLGGRCESTLFGTSPPQPFAIPLFPSCIRPANNAILVGALDDGNVFSEWAFKKMVAQPATDAGSAETVGAFVAAEDFPVSATNHLGGVSASATLVEVSGLSVIENNSDFMGSGDLGFAGAERTVPFKKAPGFADALVVSARTNTLTPGASATIGERLAPAGVTTKSFDFATRLPEITDATLDTTNPRRPVITWTPAANLDPAGAKGGVVSFDHRGIDEFYEWFIVVPSTATTVTAPAFSADANPWLPPAEAGPTIFGGPTVTFIAASALSNNAAFRQGAAGALGGPRQALSGFAAAANGTFKVTDFRRGR